MSHACPVLASKVCLGAIRVHIGPLTSDQLNVKAADMEKVLLSDDITTTVLVK